MVLVIMRVLEIVAIELLSMTTFELRVEVDWWGPQLPLVEDAVGAPDAQRLGGAERLHRKLLQADITSFRPDSADPHCQRHTSPGRKARTRYSSLLNSVFGSVGSETLRSNFPELKC